MRRTALILAAAIALDLGVMAVAAEAQQQTREPPRIPTTSTGPTFPGPTRSAGAIGGTDSCTPGSPGPCRPGDPRPPAAGPGGAAMGEAPPACAPGERPPCHGPRDRWLPGGQARAVSGPPPADEGPGPYDPYPRETARAAPAGTAVRGAGPLPGGCVLRPGAPTDCGGGEGPAMIGSDTVVVYRLRPLPSEKHCLDTIPAIDPPYCPVFGPQLMTSCTASGGTLVESGEVVDCRLPRDRRADFERSSNVPARPGDKR